MITLHDLQEAIAECEGERRPTANTCLKLAAFYTIKNQLFPEKHAETPELPAFYSGRTDDMNSYYSDTEFWDHAKDIKFQSMMAIIDELMETLRVINPRLYAGVLRRLDEA